MIRLSDFSYRLKDGRKKYIQIIFQDESLLAVNKPSGLRVITDHWDPELPNLRDMLSSRLNKKKSNNNKSLWIVHRIDADTSGLVIFALNKNSHSLLNKSFKENTVNKTYLAIVCGCPNPTEGEINLPISYTNRGKSYISQEGKPAFTKYKVLSKFRKYSLLEVYPKTGRMHQIRVHLKEIGHPLAVDPLYHNTDRITISDLKYVLPKIFSNEGAALISRLTLHSYKISIEGIEKKKSLELTADPPKDFLAIQKALYKWNSV
jgi:23S rRNA pseudouridine1911/1915/1917 synthase